MTVIFTEMPCVWSRVIRGTELVGWRKAALNPCMKVGMQTPPQLLPACSTRTKCPSICSNRQEEAKCCISFTRLLIMMAAWSYVVNRNTTAESKWTCWCLLSLCRSKLNVRA